MVKKILKIFAIVLAVSLVGVGVLIGVMYLQGKFDEPYQEPKTLYFDYENNTLNVTYDCTNGGQSDNVYSFVLNATPQDVTELNCVMTVINGGQLIQFCDVDGKALENTSAVSTIQIGKKVYFKIKDSFDNTSEKYNEGKGEVNLSFISENDLCNADLKIKIDRTANQVSLFDFNNTENNKHNKGAFNYEKYVKVELLKKPDSWTGYFIKNENDVYIEVDENSQFSEDEVYYRKDKTLTINTIANESYLLKPIFAPENSNEPFLDGNPKIVDIFIQNGYTYENIKDTDLDYIALGKDGYYFKALQAGEYHLYVVSYPTYAIQEKFLAEFESNNNADYIFSNVYAITRHVVMQVESSNVDTVYLNEGALLNINFDLFEQNGLVVKSTNQDSLYQVLSSVPSDWNEKFNRYYRKVENSYVKVTGSTAPEFESGRYYKKISTDLNIAMSANGKAVETRYNQIKFLEDSDFISGNVTLEADTGDGGKLKIVINGNTATLSGFIGEREYYNGMRSCSLIFNDKTLKINITIPAETEGQEKIYSIDINNAISSAVSNGLTKLNFSYISAVVDGDFTDNWICKTGVVVVKTETDKNDKQTYTLGTYEVGSYLVFSKDNDNLNKKFEISSSGYGMDKTFIIRPLEDITELKLYMLLINEDYSSCYTTEGSGVNIDEITPIANILKTEIALDVVIGSSNANSLKVEDLLKIEQGSYKIPLLFVEELTAKVYTIPQIRIQRGDNNYVLVGTLKKGNNGEYNFVNELIAKSNVIGEQELYVVVPKYDYSTKNVNDLVLNLLAGLDLTEIKADESENTLEINGYLCIGDTIKLNGEEKTIVNISINSAEMGKLDVYLENVNEPITIDLTGKINKITDLANDPFNETTFKLNIGYIDAIEDNGQPKNVLHFTSTLKNNATEINNVNGTEINEGTENVTFAVSVSNETAQSVFDLIVDNNIDDTDTIPNGVQGLNQYFTIKINAYNKSDKTLYRTAFIRNNDGFSLDNADIATYFTISSLTYENHQLTLTFNIKSVSDDSFEKYEFELMFEYNNISTLSTRFTIKSNAVTGYELTANSQSYRFDDYYIVYLIDWENSNYKYTAYAIKKSDYDNPLFDIDSYSNKIELFGAESLEDANLLSSYIKALPEGYNTDEYDFNVQGGGTVLTVDDKKITINSLGETALTITNKTKTSVSETISIKVLKSSNFELKANDDNITLSESSTALSDIFTFKASENDIFNTSGLVDFEIYNLDAGFVASNNAEGENKATEYYIKTTNGNTIVTLKYDNKWKLERNTEYLLVGLSFKLKAKTLIGEVESTISYSTPIRISKNASNDMSGMEVIDYYKGTQLQLSCLVGGTNETETLFKLTNNTGNSDGAFNLEYFGYTELENLENWQENTYYSYQDGIYTLLNEKPDYWEDNYSNYYKQAWITLASGNNLTLNTTDLSIGVYDMRIRYDYITYEFKVRVRENIIIQKINGDGKLNTESNPNSLDWINNTSTRIDLSSVIKAQYVTSQEPLLTYTGANYENIKTTDLAYELIDEENGIFAINTDKEIYIDWFKTTKETTYPVTIKVVSGDIETEVVYYIKVSTDYEISTSDDYSSLKDLSTLKIEALTDQKIVLYDGSVEGSYFVLSTGNSILSDWSVLGIKFYNENGEELDYIKFAGADGYKVTIKCEKAINENLIAYMDIVYVVGFEDVSNADDWEDGLIYSYYEGNFSLVTEKPTGWDDDIEFDFTNYFKAKTLTSGELYPVTFTPYKLDRITGSNYKEITTDKETKFTDLFNIDWDIVEKAEVEVNNSDITTYNSNILTENNADLTLKGESKGSDYTTKITIRLHFKDSDIVYSYDYDRLIIRNANYAEVNYTFKDLKINLTDLTFVDSSLNTIGNLNEELGYDLAISNETLDVKDRFKIYKRSEDSLTNKELYSITLVGVANLQLDFNWQTKISISGSTITFGAFEYGGYALFKLADSDGTWCYYLVRVTPAYMSDREDYRNILVDNERKTVEKVITLSDNTQLSNLIKNEDTTKNDNYITSADISTNFSVPNQLILDYFYNVKYYLIENDYNYISGTDDIGKQLASDYSFREVLNTISFTIAVVIETQNGLVHLGNYKIYIKPNVSVSPQVGVEVVDDKNFIYSTEIDYIDYAFENATDSDSWDIGKYYEKKEDNKYVLITDETLFTTNPTNYYKKRESVTISMDEFISVDGLSVYEVRITNLTDCVKIDNNKLKLLKQVSELTEFNLILTYDTGFIVTIQVKYLPFVNTNTVRNYSLGWNGSKFVTRLDLAQLVPNYTGSASIEHNGISDISNTSSATDLSSMSLNYLLTDNVQTGTLTITLNNVVGNPSYTFNITLNTNINVDIAQGFDSSNPAKTKLTSDASQINLTINGSNVILTGSEIIANINLTDDPTSVSITFRDLNGNEEYLSDTYSGLSATTEIQFIPTASEVSGILTISVNGHETEIYLNIVQSYQVQANYRLTQYVKVESVSDWGTTNIYKLDETNYSIQYTKPADWDTNFANYYKNAVDYETVKVGDILTLSEFNTGLPTCDVGDDYLINANRLTANIFANLSDTETTNDSYTNFASLFTTDTTRNKLKFQICYNSTDGIVVDSEGAYASISTDNIVTFHKEGTVYLRIYNDTGLDLYYRLEIQTEATYYNNITFNSDNTSQGKVTVVSEEDSEEIQYYSTTLTELENDGYRLGRLKFSPTKDLYFNAYVNNASLNGTDDIANGDNRLYNTDDYSGKFEVSGITLSWKISGYDIIYTISKGSEITFAYFDIVLITINGEAQKVRLYVTDTEIKFGATTAEGVVLSNKIYANRDDISLWGNIDNHEGYNGNQRVQIYNGQSLIDNTYSVDFKKAYNATLGVDDSSIVSENKEYSFDLTGVATDTNLIVYYDLLYNDIIIDRIEYQITVMNDINISINGFRSSSGVYEGNIYLADYPYEDAGMTTIDLINKTSDETYYRNAYIIYENRRMGTKLFDGSNKNNNYSVSNYMKFELVNDYLQNFDKSDIQINDDGTIYLLKDTDGRFAIRITAQYSTSYSQVFVFNVVPSIVVSSTGYDDGNDGYNSNEERNLVTTKLGESNTMFYVKNQKHDNKYVCVESQYSDEGISFSYKYAIVENPASVSSIDWTTISLTKVTDMTGGVFKINLPYVPVSTTQKYIVSYQITIASRNTERTFVGSYLVKNNIEITLVNEDKKIENVSDTNYELTLANLVTIEEDFRNKSMVAFRNIVDDDDSSKNIDVYFDISSGTINLKEAKYIVDSALKSYTGTIFNNNMTFDFVFVDKTNLTDLYTISGWTMTTTNSITPKNEPKALSDLFTETELGNNLYNKRFVAVSNGANPDASLLANTGNIDTSYGTGGYKEEKTIERTSNTYKIYSAKLTSGTTGTFYTNSVVYYFIVSDTTDFIETKGNYYIGQVIKLEKVITKNNGEEVAQYYMLDGNGNRISSDDDPSDLVIDVSNYLRIWSGDSWSYNGTITDVTTTYGNVEIIDSYYIKITTDKLYELLTGKNEANHSFGITVIYNSVQLDYQVSLNITLVKTTDESTSE